MKIEEKDDIIVLYLMGIFFDNLEMKELTIKVKDLFIKLIEYYKYDLRGEFNVFLYENKKYGTVIEIKKIDELLFPRELIDIKLKVYKNKKFYFKTNDMFYIKEYSNIYYDNNNYYLDIDYIDNYLNIVEFGRLLYKEKDDYLNKMKFIK